MDTSYNKKVVKDHYPDYRVKNKNGYYYITSDSFKGYTLGSGQTMTEAWDMARDSIEERLYLVEEYINLDDDLELHDI